MEAALDVLAGRGCTLAVCTNKLERLSVRLLTSLGLANRFVTICGQDTFGVQKPDPQALPGTVTVVDVAEGQQVTTGARLLVLEAMKMEHVLTAPVTGVVRELRARPGGTVERDAMLLVIDP